MSLKLTTPAVEEPVTLDEIKEQCRIDADQSDQDNLLMMHAVAARQWVEGLTALSIVPQTFDLVIDGFPAKDAPISLPKIPLIDVTYVRYIDPDGAEQTWDESNYIIDDAAFFARIAPAVNVSYPATQSRIAAVTIRFTAGYAIQGSPATEETLPEAVRQALLLKVQSLYDGTDLDRTIESLLSSYRGWGY